MKSIHFWGIFIFCNLIFSQKKDQVQLFDSKLNEFLNVRDLSISQNEDEVYFTVQSPTEEIAQIVFMKKVKDKWSEPELMPFCDEFKYLEPFLSHDEKKLFFVSDRPLNKNNRQRKDVDIWFVERKTKSDAWSEPINIGSPINSSGDEFYPTLSKNGNLYFTMDAASGLGKDDIYFSELKNGTYSSPKLLSENINSSGYEFNAFISKDETFLIYTKYNEKDGFGSGDLYISQKNNNGEWEKAVNLGQEINTKYMEYCPFYNQNTEMLYFTSKRNDLVPRKFSSLKDFQLFVNETHNGLSKIYKIKLTLH